MYLNRISLKKVDLFSILVEAGGIILTTYVDPNEKMPINMYQRSMLNLSFWTEISIYIHFSQKPQSQFKWTFIRSINWMRQSQHGFMFFSILCLLCLCARLFICGLLSPAGEGLTSWLSFVVSAVSLSLSHWYPGSGVVLDCIDSWSLHPYLLLYLLKLEALYLLYVDPNENLKCL